MNKKKLTKATSGLLLTALMVGGAAAFLSTSQTGTKTNSIKIGQITVVFDNQQDVITLNDMYPMTRAYAEANLTPYTFTVDNDGDIDVLYSLRAVTEEGAEIDASLIDLILDDGSIVKLSESNLLKNKALRHGTSDVHKLLAYIDETAVNDDVVGKATSFHLELSAVQMNMADADTIANYYNGIQKSALETSITVGGQTKQVETYNIEGDSKTELLAKLEESGLANAADVDAIIEVKGEDYDGLNSTAEFDVSSIANEGDTVVILHFNENTGEWEYIGSDTVSENGKVSGEFTSYSPVAFVVLDKNGNIVSSGSQGETGDNEEAAAIIGYMHPTLEGGSIDASSTVSFTEQDLIDGGYISGTSMGNLPKGIVSINIPEGITTIGGNAFTNNAYLESVVLPTSLTTIVGNAFQNASNLSSINIAESVSVQNYAFYGCEKLANEDGLVYINGTVFDYYQGGTVNVPDGATRIAMWGLSAYRSWGQDEAAKLTSVYLPHSITDIDRYAFMYQYSLTDVYYDGTVEEWNAITKTEQWDTLAPGQTPTKVSFVIHCSDGDVNIE